jgi:hypothetical protein
MKQYFPYGSTLVLVLVSTIVLVAQSTASAAAQDSIDKEVGVWKMNPEKSHWPGVTSPISRQMTVEKQGPNTVRIVMDTVTQDGQKHRQELVRGYDSKERPVPGQTGLTQACEVLDAKTTLYGKARGKSRSRLTDGALGRQKDPLRPADAV